MISLRGNQAQSSSGVDKWPAWLASMARATTPPALIFLFWEAACRFSGINDGLLPRPETVVRALLDAKFTRSLPIDIFWSMRRAVLGLAVGGSLGVLVGVLTGRIRIFEWVLMPILNGCRALPPVAMVPLVVVWAGLDESAKVFITSWAAFFPIWLNTHAGVASIDKNLIWAGRSLGAHGMGLLLQVALPAALPYVVVGTRLAISTVLLCVVVAEMTGAYNGIGYRLQAAYLVFRVDRMLVCMAILAAIAILADRGFNALISRVFPWIALNREAR